MASQSDFDWVHSFKAYQLKKSDLFKEKRIERLLTKNTEGKWEPYIYIGLQKRNKKIKIPGGVTF